MAASRPHKIVLIPAAENLNYDEAFAVAALKPGHLLEKVSTGKVQKNSVTAAAGVYRDRIVAIEDSLQGKTITDSYDADNPVRIHRALPGDVLLMRVPAAAAAIVIGDELMPDNTGCLVKRTTTLPVFAKAEEAIDNSAGGAEAFIKVRII